MLRRARPLLFRTGVGRRRPVLPRRVRPQWARLRRHRNRIQTRLRVDPRRRTRHEHHNRRRLWASHFRAPPGRVLVVTGSSPHPHGLAVRVDGCQGVRALFARDRPPDRHAVGPAARLGGSAMLRVRLATSSVLGVILVSCGNLTDHAVSGPDQPVVTEHRFVAPRQGESALAQRGFGSDCTQHGAPTCAPGICLHVAHDRNAGFVCSRQCVGNEDCPNGWSCSQTHPAPGGAMCVPGGLR